MRPLATAAALCAVLVFVASCSSEHGVDSSDVEDTLEDDFITADVPVDKARCPDDVDEAVGGTFECTVEVAGQPLTVVATLADRDGEVTLEQEQEVLITADLNEQVRAQLTDELGAEVTVVCDERPALVVESGAHLTCGATDSLGATLDVDVEVGPEGIAVIRNP